MCKYLEKEQGLDPGTIYTENGGLFVSCNAERQREYQVCVQHSLPPVP